MDSSPSATAPTMSSLSSTVDVAAHRSCTRCSRRMSSIKYDKHTLCISCRDVTCSLDLHCVECTAWSTDEMAEYLRHRKSLVSKGMKKSLVSTPSSSSPSVPSSATPNVASSSPSPALSSIADDENIKQYVQSVLANMLSHQSSQASLGFNPFLSAPLEVPDIPPPGSTGGRGSESLKRGRFASPSGVVPPAEEDVLPPINVSVQSSVASWGVDSLHGSPFPPLGEFTPVSGSQDQLRSRGMPGFTQHIVSADVHDVLRSVSSTFDPSSLLFPFSDSGFSSLSSHPPLSLPSSSPTASLCFLLLLLLLFLFSRFLLLFLRLFPFSLLFLLLLSLRLPLPLLLFPSPLPSGSFSSAPSLRPSAPPLVSLSAPSSFPPVSAPAPPALGSSWLSSLPPPSAPNPSSGVSSFSSASPSDDFAAVQASVLGLSAEYQAVACWFFASVGC